MGPKQKGKTGQQISNTDLIESSGINTEAIVNALAPTTKMQTPLLIYGAETNYEEWKECVADKLGENSENLLN